MQFGDIMEILKYTFTLGCENRKSKKFDQSFISKRPFKYSIKVYDAGDDGYDTKIQSDFDITTLCSYVDEDLYWARKYTGEDNFFVYLGQTQQASRNIVSKDIKSQVREVVDLLDELNRDLYKDLTHPSRSRN